MSKIIDAHSHYMPPEVAQNTMFFKVGWSDICQQLKVMDTVGIDRALLLYPTSDAHLNMGGWKNVCEIYNEKISEILSKYEGRFIGAGILPIDSPLDFGSELKRIKKLELKVISLASSYDGIYLDDDIYSVIYDFARGNDMPIHVHSQIINPIGENRVKDPLLTPVLEYVMDVSICIGKMMMSGTFLRYPEVKFIFAHYGGVIPFIRERFDTTYAMLRGRELVKDLGKIPSDYLKNIYFDTSGSKSDAALQCMLESAESSKVLFGSDFPANKSVELSIESLNKSSINKKDKKNIFENAVLGDL